MRLALVFLLLAVATIPAKKIKSRADDLSMPDGFVSIFYYNKK
jgi:hypothetical protein